MNNPTIRTIKPGDNPFIASIIRDSLQEFGANKPGTVFFDNSTDYLFELFRQEGAIYYIIEHTDAIVGGAGIFPSKGLPDGVCELVKMYLKKEARGYGLGKQLISQCLGFAASYGYKSVYLETMPELKRAVSLYEKLGFIHLPGPMGDTGHYGCDVWMQKAM